MYRLEFLKGKKYSNKVLNLMNDNNNHYNKNNNDNNNNDNNNSNYHQINMSGSKISSILNQNQIGLISHSNKNY